MIPYDVEVARQFVATLPFKLTDGQRVAAHEILTDLAAPGPMNRLLQGDVGSGKTVVAALAALMTHQRRDADRGDGADGDPCAAASRDPRQAADVRTDCRRACLSGAPRRRRAEKSLQDLRRATTRSSSARMRSSRTTSSSSTSASRSSTSSTASVSRSASDCARHPARCRTTSR